MTAVLVLSKNRDASKWFGSISKSRSYELRLADPGDLRKEITTVPPGTLVYLDVDGLPEGVTLKSLRHLSRQTAIRFGVLDPGAAITDVAELFHLGAADYLGSSTLGEGVTTRRVSRVLAFKETDHPGDDGQGSTKTATVKRWAAPVSGPEWTGVRAGQEYTFCFLFVELDGQEAYKREYGEESLRSLLSTFHGFVEGQLTPHKGQRWIWGEFGGLMLLPFDGARCDAVVTCFRILLNRHLASIEIWDFDVVPSFRMVLHIGGTVYRARGQTGHIVSDSVNVVFHLGQRFAKPGKFYVTQEVARFIPKGLAEYFVPAGRFEGQDVLRMRLPL